MKVGEKEVTTLSSRDQEVLKAVVTDYISYGEPVGSRTISKKYIKNISPATIRNIMADLEELGYLYQPHASAGRIPTEKGLRLYIEFLMESRKIKEEEEYLIRKAYKDLSGSTDEILKVTSKILSEFCCQVGIVMLNRVEEIKFKRIEFIKLHDFNILVILVSESGIIHQRFIRTDEDISQEDLDKYSRYLNDILKNLTLKEVKEKILNDMAQDKAIFDEIYFRTLGILKKALSDDSSLNASLYIEGQSNLFNNPEFSDVERMKRILRALEDKSRIIKLLDMAVGSTKGVQIIFGPEINIQELREIGIVSSPYKRGDVVLGVLGVMGPMRMDYARIIPLVEFTANVLSEYIESPSKIES